MPINIKQLKENGTQFYPETHTEAVIDANGNALDTVLTQLEAKVDNLSGKYYGFFDDPTDLPDAIEEEGYAFVGTEEPFAIWQFDGEEWTDTGATANAIQGEPGVGLDDVESPTPADGTVELTLSNGYTVTIDMNHNHPQYLKYVMLESEDDMPLDPDPTTLYMWPEE